MHRIGWKRYKAMLKDELLTLFEENRDTSMSGQMLADRFHVSRNAVWKAVNQLKQEGHAIVSDQAKGYRLSGGSDVISEAGLRAFLEKRPDLNIDVYNELDSTNNEAKRRLGNGDHRDILILADHQTGGRGRMGHTFFSPAGTGIYMTLSLELGKTLYHPERITLAAAVAVVRALSPWLDEDPGLKWVNDIFYKGKKVAGILSEAVTDLETGLIQHVIVGIGLNIRPMEFPEELKDIAGSFGLASPSRNELIARITNELFELYRDLEDDSFMEEYLRYSIHPDKVKRELGLK